MWSGGGARQDPLWHITQTCTLMAVFTLSFPRWGPGLQGLVEARTLNLLSTYSVLGSAFSVDYLWPRKPVGSLQMPRFTDEDTEAQG